MTTQTEPLRGREVHLVARPHGEPRESDFALVSVDVPPPAEGEVLVRNAFMSVDPYMRGRMNDVRSYTPPFQLNRALEGGAVGRVVASRVPSLAPGDAVLHHQGWRDYARGEAKLFTRVDPALAPLSAYLGVLGMPGLTAYVGLLDMAQFKPGDTVFVSGAAGAVGSLVGQIAKLRGAARVVGSAGADDKVAWLCDQLGFDAAFNYKHGGAVAAQLAAAAPEGIDVYFDNVGGEHLEAAISAMKLRGRIALCGAIAQYNATEGQPGPRNLAAMIGKRLTMRGFIVSDHGDRLPEFHREVGGWLRAGKVRYRETVVAGLEHAPRALIGLLRGENTGKMVVEISSG